MNISVRGTVAFSTAVISLHLCKDKYSQLHTKSTIWAKKLEIKLPIPSGVTKSTTQNYISFFTAGCSMNYLDLTSIFSHIELQKNLYFQGSRCSDLSCRYTQGWKTSWLFQPLLGAGTATELGQLLIPSWITHWLWEGRHGLVPQKKEDIHLLLSSRRVLLYQSGKLSQLFLAYYPWSKAGYSIPA